MTRELLQEANRLNHAIDDLDNQIAITEGMHHCDVGLTLKVEGVGSITIAYNDELKDDIIDLVLRRLNKDKDDMEDKLRLL
jgi:hypothetical protein